MVTKDDLGKDVFVVLVDEARDPIYEVCRGKLESFERYGRAQVMLHRAAYWTSHLPGRVFLTRDEADALIVDYLTTRIADLDRERKHYESQRLFHQTRCKSQPENVSWDEID